MNDFRMKFLYTWIIVFILLIQVYSMIRHFENILAILNGKTFEFSK